MHVENVVVKGPTGDLPELLVDELKRIEGVTCELVALAFRGETDLLGSGYTQHTYTAVFKHVVKT